MLSKWTSLCRLGNSLYGMPFPHSRKAWRITCEPVFTDILASLTLISVTAFYAWPSPAIAESHRTSTSITLNLPKVITVPAGHMLELQARNVLAHDMQPPYKRWANLNAGMQSMYTAAGLQPDTAFRFVLVYINQLTGLVTFSSNAVQARTLAQGEYWGKLLFSEISVYFCYCSYSHSLPPPTSHPTSA